MSSKRYAEEFKVEAIKQVTERWHPAAAKPSKSAGLRGATLLSVQGVIVIGRMARVVKATR